MQRLKLDSKHHQFATNNFLCDLSSANIFIRRSWFIYLSVQGHENICSGKEGRVKVEKFEKPRSRRDCFFFFRLVRL